MEWQAVATKPVALGVKRSSNSTFIRERVRSGLYLIPTFHPDLRAPPAHQLSIIPLFNT